MTEKDETLHDPIAMLRQMQTLADTLCLSDDPLIAGQGRHLHGRITGFLSLLGDDVADLLGVTGKGETS